MIVDRIAYANKWTLLRPDTKIMSTLLLLVAVLLAPTPVLALTSLVVAALFVCIGARIKINAFGRWIALALFFLVPALLPILFVVGDPATRYQASAMASFHIGPWLLVITQESLQTSVMLGVRSLSAVGCMMYLALTTPMSDILFQLQKWHVPLVLIEMANLIYRLIFVLAELLENAVNSQAVRNGYRTVRGTISSAGILLGALFTRVFHRSREMGYAMECRLGGEFTRTLPKELPSRQLRDVVIIGTPVLVLAAVIVARVVA